MTHCVACVHDTTLVVALNAIQSVYLLVGLESEPGYLESSAG